LDAAREPSGSPPVPVPSPQALHRRVARFPGRSLALIPAARLAACLVASAAGRLADFLRGSFATPARRAELRAARERRDLLRLARALGDLKGAYAKLGQFASVRYDALPADVRAALASLRDSVPPLPFALVRAVVERELGLPLDAAFAEIDPEPLGAASIAQVHRGRLHDGRLVAVKVQYPWLRASLGRDLALVRAVLAVLSLGRRRRREERRRLFAEFARGLAEELDFEREARVAGEIARNLAGEPRVVVPEVVASHSTARVLTTTYLPAVPILDRAALRRLGADPAELLEILVRAYGRQVFVDGLFHADPHPGNLFVVDEPGGRAPRVLFVDFGLSRRLDPALRRELRLAIHAVLRGDAEALLAGMDRLGMIAPGAREGVRAAALRMLARLRAEGTAPLALRGDRVLALKDEAKALLAETEGVQLPQDLLLYAKTLSYLFALGAELAPEVDVTRLCAPFLLGFLAERDAAEGGAPTARAAGGAAPGAG
jgi:predicted unusual protein kinase regulating ubiquinone biosynthesis (AarF/ABC1/UbiB family)